VRSVEATDTLARIASGLQKLESQCQLRHLDTLEGTDFTSNDYLGLAHHPRLAEAVIQALRRGEAAGSTGSRLLSGNARAWEDLESEFAGFVGAESALFFASGYAANMGLLGAVVRPEDLVFSDSANHASIIDGIRLTRAQKVIFPHLDLSFLEDALRKQVECGQKFVVVESIFSMDGDRAPLSDLARLAERYGAALIVDEAHATGVVGPAGRGALAEAGLTGVALASVHTCGKALASAGAFVACAETLKRWLVNRARSFIFSTALPPYFAAQIHAALEIASGSDDRRSRLNGLANELRASLAGKGWNTGKSSSQIIPVILGTNTRALTVADHLRRAGFAVRAIRPPSVTSGTARLRLSLNAGLSDKDIARLVRELDNARDRALGVGG
jgi:8-amino-7-oxononanoate synthase